MRASFAGFMLWLVKLRYGRERAAARVLEVMVEDADGTLLMLVVLELCGVVPAAPDMLFDCPCLGACCFFSCRALARALSWVRTN